MRGTFQVPEALATIVPLHLRDLNSFIPHPLLAMSVRSHLKLDILSFSMTSMHKLLVSPLPERWMTTSPWKDGNWYPVNDQAEATEATAGRAKARVWNRITATVRERLAWRIVMWCGMETHCDVVYVFYRNWDVLSKKFTYCLGSTESGPRVNGIYPSRVICDDRKYDADLMWWFDGDQMVLFSCIILWILPEYRNHTHKSSLFVFLMYTSGEVCKGYVLVITRASTDLCHSSRWSLMLCVRLS